MGATAFDELARWLSTSNCATVALPVQLAHVAETPLQTLPYAAVIALLLLLRRTLPVDWPELCWQIWDPAACIDRCRTRRAAPPPFRAQKAYYKQPGGREKPRWLYQLGRGWTTC